MDVHISLGPVGERTGGHLPPACRCDHRGQALPARRCLRADRSRQRSASPRTTVAVAYDRLGAEGFTVTASAGTFVAAGRCPDPPDGHPHGRSVAARLVWSGMSVPSTERSRAPFDFAIGVPDPALFPLIAWRRQVANELQPSCAARRLRHPAGLPRLREAIARQIGLSDQCARGPKT